MASPRIRTVIFDICRVLVRLNISRAQAGLARVEAEPRRVVVCDRKRPSLAGLARRKNVRA